MNVRVDLILETERRSANVVNAKSVARVSTIVAPLIVVVIIALFAFNMWQLNSSLSALKHNIATEAPKKLVVQRFEADLAANQMVLNELEGWKHARIDWAPQLAGIQQQIPAQVQLFSLSIRSDLQPTNSMTGRFFTLSLNGQAVGDTAQALVIQLQNTLPLAPALSNAFIGPPKVTKFTGPPTPTEETRNDRIFQIDCSYKPGIFQ